MIPPGVPLLSSETATELIELLIRLNLEVQALGPLDVRNGRGAPAHAVLDQAALG